MRALSILLLTSLLGAVPPQITNVTVFPNPFSPNGDGKKDETTFHFSLSQSAYLTLRISTPTGFVTLIDSLLYPPGAQSFPWDGSGLPDTSYIFQLFAFNPAGEASDTTTGIVTVDTEPPQILNVNVYPNPFSPNGDGIDDFLTFEFDVIGTHPRAYDTYFLPLNRIGRIVVDTLGASFHPDHAPALPPFPTYFALLPIHYPPDVTDHSFTFLNWIGQTVDITVPSEPAFLYRVGGLTDLMTSVNFATTPVDTDSVVVDLFAFMGNGNITVYDSTGTVVFNHDMVAEFRGDRGYRVLWTPSDLPDGVYTFKIQVEDGAANLQIFTGTVVANSVPTTVSNLTVSPPAISPENRDNVKDGALIRYTLSEPAEVTVRIHNSPTLFDSTTLVRSLLEAQRQAGGEHALTFDGRSDAGNFLASGAESTYTVVVSVFDPTTGDADRATAEIRIDNEPPPPPSLDTLSLARVTADTVDTLTGFTEPGGTVRIFRNNLLYAEVQADTVTGLFAAPILLEEGPNRIFAVALDDVGNESSPSDTLVSISDREIPRLLEAFPPDSAFIRDTLDRVWVRVTDDVSGISPDAFAITLRKSGISVPGTPGFSGDTLLLVLADPILPGGSDDGLYTLTFTIFDSAGNRFSDTLSFVFDSRPPTLVLSPSQGAFVSRLDTLRITLSDALSGVEPESTHARLTGPNGEVTGTLLRSDTLALFLPSTPLRRDGTDDGAYRFRATAMDRAGNPAADSTDFLYDTQAPRLLSWYPGPGYTTTPLTRIWALPTDTLPGSTVSGLNPSASSLRLYGPDGAIVPGTQIFSGDTLLWVLADTLRQEGLYTVEVILQDSAGNSRTDSLNFGLDLGGPQIVTAFPTPDGYVRDSLSGVWVVLSDGDGVGVDSASVALTVEGPGGLQIPGTFSFHADTAFFLFLQPLPTDGSADGLYRIILQAQDLLGQPLSPANPETLRFTYDTQAPTLIEASHEGPINPPTLDTLWVRIADPTSGPNLAASNLVLRKGGTPLGGTVLRGGDTLYFVPTQPLDDGRYALEVLMVDLAQNLRRDTIRFTLDRQPPVFSFIPSPGGFAGVLPGSRVLAMVEDTLSGPVLPYYIQLFDPQGDSVPGFPEALGDTAVAYVISPPLREDGTDDGLYTITAMAWDSAGNLGADTSTFIYDTYPPQVAEAFPSEPWVGLPLNRVWVILQDTVPGRAVSGVDFPASDLRLYRLPDSLQVPGQQSFQGDTLSWNLAEPLDEGAYLLLGEFWDQAQNRQDFFLTFGVDLSGPVVVASDPPDGGYTGGPLSRAQVTVVDSGVGVDPASAQIQVIGPGGFLVPGAAAWAGDTLRYTFAQPLPTDGSADGVYRVILSVSDALGHPLPASAETLRFTYDTQPPQVAESFPSGAVADTLDTLWVRGTDATSGLNLASSDLRLWAGETLVTGTVLRRPPDTLYFIPDEPLVLNALPPGLDLVGEGFYRLVVTLMDLAGNLAQDTLNFRIDRTAPFLELLPSDSALLSTFTRAVLILQDTLSGADLTASSLSLTGPNGPVPGTLLRIDTPAEDSLIFLPTPPLRGDGTDDGRYWLTGIGVDGAGNRDTLIHTFLYDTQTPFVVEVFPDSGFVTEPLIRVWAVVSDTLPGREVSGVDPGNSFLYLLDPQGALVPGQGSSRGDTLFWTLFDTLRTQGIYTLRVGVTDRVGHRDSTRTTFTLDLAGPQILQATPANGTFVTASLGRVQVVFDDGAGSGLDPGSVGLTVVGPDGGTIPGFLEVTGDTATYVFLQPLPEDGSADGRYTVIVLAQDRVGHPLEPTNPETLRFTYDTQAPYTAEGYPTGLINTPPETLWARGTDLTSGLNLPASDLSLWRDGALIPGTLFRVPPDTLKFVPQTGSGILRKREMARLDRIDIEKGAPKQGLPFPPPAPQVLADGTYRIIPLWVDSAGNLQTDTLAFTLDTHPPTIAFFPPSGSKTSVLDTLSAFLEDALSGVNFEAASLSLTGPNGPVAGATGISGNALQFFPSPPLRRDGSDDGLYEATAIAPDQAGNADTALAFLIYDTQAPFPTATFPEPEAIVTAPFTRVWARVSDQAIPGRTPSGVDFYGSTIGLLDPAGAPLPGIKQVSGDTLIWQLSAPPETLGFFTLVLTLVDSAGNSDTTAISFIYDPAGPVLRTLIPTPDTILSGTLTEAEALLDDPGGSGINFDPGVTFLRILDPLGRPLAGTLSNNGLDALTFSLTSPLQPDGSDDGFYRIVLRAEDQAGNPLEPTNPDTFGFIFDNLPPFVVATWPEEGASGVLLRDSVYAVVSDRYPGIDSVAGVDFAASRIRLYGPDGRPVPGYQSHVDYGDGSGVLIWHLTTGTGQLPPGDYRLRLRVMDRGALSLDTTYTFTAADLRPVVVQTDPEEGAVVAQVTEVRALVWDRTGAGIDTALSEIRLKDSTGTVVPGTESFVGDTLVEFRYTLTQPLQVAGPYTIEVYPVTVDSVAGERTQRTFFFDPDPPLLLATSPPQNGTIYRSPARIWAYYYDRSGLDSLESSAALQAPDGSTVPGTARVSGDTLIYTLSVSLTLEGSYTAHFQAVDLAGNTHLDTLRFTYLHALSARTRPAQGDTVRTPLDTVYAYVLDRTGTGLGTVQLSLIGPQGDTLAGTQRQLDDTTFAYVLSTPLPADGSANGLYQIGLSARNGAGDSLDLTATFLYLVDTVAPPVPQVADTLPTTVYKDTLYLQGLGEPQSWVFGRVNGVVADSAQVASDSTWSLALPLSLGTNEIALYAVDPLDNVSDTLRFTVQRTPPPFRVFPARPFREDQAYFTLWLPQNAHVTLRIFNLAGDLVYETEADLTAGTENRILWAGLQDLKGQSVRNGPYIYQIEVRYPDGTVERKRDAIAVVR